MDNNVDEKNEISVFGHIGMARDSNCDYVTHGNSNVESAESILANSSVHNSRRARRLWRRLAEVLRRHSFMGADGDPAANGGVRSRKKCTVSKHNSQLPSPRYETFELIRWEPVETLSENDDATTDDCGERRAWWRATLTRPKWTTMTNDMKESTKLINSNEPLSLFVTFVAPSMNADDLAGFDNTGNVRVWASEEVMTYWSTWALLAELRQSSRIALTICELGGGMTCLCGFFLASSLASAREKGDEWASRAIERLILTDGNDKCVDNTRLLLEKSCLTLLDGCARIESRLLKFGHLRHGMDDLAGKVDIALAADCLFFTESHGALTETLYFLLKPGGRAFLFAPERHGTLRQFMSRVARGSSFSYRLVNLLDTSLFYGVRVSLGKYAKATGGGNDDIEGRVDFPKLLVLEKL